MAVKNRTDLKATLVANITDALNKQNTATRVREIIDDLIDSSLNSIDDASSPTVFYNRTVVIPSADVLTSFATPIELIPAPSIGKAVFPLRVIAQIDYNSTAYATNTNALVYIDTATKNCYKSTGVLAKTTNSPFFLNQESATGATETQILESKALMFATETGNPTAGNSDVILYITYAIVNV